MLRGRTLITKPSTPMLRTSTYFDVSTSGLKMGHRNQGGRVLCLAPKSFDEDLKGTPYPIEWHSTVIRRVCKSTMQAETLSLQQGAVEAEHLRAVIHGLHEDCEKLQFKQWVEASQKRTSVLWITDCFSLYSHFMNPVAGLVTEKRLAIDLSSMRQELWREAVNPNPKP